MPSQRLFVSLELPPTIAALLVRLNPRLPGVRWTEADKIHLTLAFLGYVGAETREKLEARLSAIEFAPFFLSLTGIGAFPDRGQPKIIWLGVGHGHPHLFQLHKRVTDAALTAGIEPDLRPWHPHFTLGRCQQSPGSLRNFLREHVEFDAGLIRFDSFALKSSLLTPAGSIYSTELTVPATRR